MKKYVGIWNGQVVQRYSLRSIRRGFRSTIFEIWSDAWQRWVDLEIKDRDSWKICN